ncbi:phosphate/phosphite/phosphonate ABC transporter substrate-binding protein [Kaistia adipata]|uniref:phosphate/phosphite/phosphonate ABC transporter substrate-binding protein n=1 Tax=Kaistia adipata TaxID=166954 RepID=UPI0004080855|nr:phosphate/phosphite/phosphonate ABC transporter substrate-binding protein [Kaistia adipata]
MTRRRAPLLAALALAAQAVAAGPAAAGWRDDLGTLKVGFIAGDNPAYEIARLEKFRWQLQLNLALPVELYPARDYEALIEAQSTGRVQYTVLSSLAYLALNQRCGCAEALAQPTTAEHARGFRALLVAKKDGPVQTLADARNMRLAVGAADSLSGRRAPFAGLGAEGIDPESYFLRIVETSDSEAALAALAAGSADIATAWSSATDPLSADSGSGPFARLAGDGTLDPASLKVIWQSALIPFGPHAVRKELAPEAKQALLRALTEMQASAPEAYDAIERGFPGGFVAADQAEFDALAALLKIAPDKP